MTTQPAIEATPIRDLGQLAGDYLEILDQIEHLQQRLGTVKHQIIEVGGIGSHDTENGIKVVITNPPRRFNPDKAWTMLTPEQQQVCLSPDSAKIKKQLPPVLAEECMDEGTGSPRVMVR